MAKPKDTLACPHCTIMSILDSLVEQTGSAEASATVIGMVLGDALSSARDEGQARGMLAAIFHTAFSKACDENTDNALAVATMLGFHITGPANDDHVH